MNRLSDRESGMGASVPDQALAVPATPANAVDGPSGFDPSRDQRWEVRPLADDAGNILAYDICLPSEPEAAGVGVVATIYSGKDVADDIVWQHNTPFRRAALAAMVRIDEELDLYGQPSSEAVPPAFTKLVTSLRSPPYWTAEYAPGDARVDIAPRHASDALEIVVDALLAVKRVSLACEGTAFDLILSYADNALRSAPSGGFWVRYPASAIETQSATTAGRGPEDESAARSEAKGDAQP